jgi:hypothetical protein
MQRMRDPRIQKIGNTVKGPVSYWNGSVEIDETYKTRI